MRRTLLLLALFTFAFPALAQNPRNTAVALSDCTTLTCDASANDGRFCFDKDDGSLWRCESSSWVRKDIPACAANPPTGTCSGFSVCQVQNASSWGIYGCGADDAWYTISGAGDGQGYATMQDEGTPLTQRGTVNFTGAGITCTDSGSITVCDVTSGSGDMTQAVYDSNADSTVDTAAALAANGANCSAGQYPLGVDASGAVEGCTPDADTTCDGAACDGTSFSNVDAVTVDSLDSTQFLRSDANDSMAGNLLPGTDNTYTLGNASFNWSSIFGYDFRVETQVYLENSHTGVVWRKDESAGVTDGHEWTVSANTSGILQFAVAEVNGVAGTPDWAVWAVGIDWLAATFQAAGAGGTGTISPASLTSDRTYTMPDKTGTFAMTSDLIADTTCDGAACDGTSFSNVTATGVAANSVALGTDTTGGYAASATEGGDASGVAANSVALGGDTTGNYAAGDGEAGNATGVACTDCVALGSETTGNYAGSSSEGGSATSAETLSETAALPVREHDYDSDGDGTTVEERLVGDYDGDGTLELADIQSALENICDANGDGTTDNLEDIDGDGTDERYCGAVLRILPGTYGTGTAYDSINLDSGITGYTLKGSGINQTILKAEYTRATLCGGSGPGTNQGLINAAGDNVTISDLTIIGVGERSSAITDCDEDGTSSGGNDLAAQHGIQIGVSVSDHAENIIVERVRILNSDRMGIHFNWTRDAIVRDVEVDGAGEHGFASACAKGLQIVDSVFRKASNTSRSRGVEIFCSGTGGSSENILIANNRFEENARHIWAFTSNDNSTISRLTILGNSLEDTDYDDTSANNAGRAIEIGGSASSTGAISQVLIARNQIAGSQAACISIAGISNPLDSIQITGNQLSNCESERKQHVSGSGDGGSIRIQDTAGVTGLVIDANDIEVDRGLAGMVVYGTQSVVKGNTLRGTLDASNDGRRAMIYTNSGASRAQIIGNDIDLDGSSSNKIYGIYVDGTDDVRVSENHVSLDANNNVNGIGINVGSDRGLYQGNKVIGGDNGFEGANGAATSVSLVSNYVAPSYTGDNFSWAYNLFYGTTCKAWGNASDAIGSSPAYRWGSGWDHWNNVELDTLAVDGSGPVLASPPVTCGSGYLGAEYTDDSGAKCWCDGSTWTVVAGSGTCA